MSQWLVAWFRAKEEEEKKKTGIFARKAMVDQARENLCYQRETWRF